MTYEMQGEWQTVSDRLTNLNTTIRQDAILTLDKSETLDEIDFLFPELTRIRDHDLVSIGAWKNRIEWSKELSPAEMQQLKAIAADESTEVEDITDIESHTEEKPAEYAFYEDAKSNFVPEALYESLVYSFDSEARQQGENYIAERAALASLKAFSSQNLKNASPLAVANLNLYFAAKDESLEEEVKENRAIAEAA